MDLLVFEIGDSRYGIDVRVVQEVVRAVLITPLPGAPPVVEGIIDVRGQIVPVYDLRARLGLRPRALHVEDRFILAWAGRRFVALHSERTDWLVRIADDALERSGTVALGDRRLVGAAKTPDGIILITDLSAFLDDAERTALDDALAALPGRTA